MLHRSGDPLVEIGQGRYLAEHIPRARFVELPGQDRWPWIGDATPVIDEIASHASRTAPVSTPWSRTGTSTTASARRLTAAASISSFTPVELK